MMNDLADKFATQLEAHRKQVGIQSQEKMWAWATDLVDAAIQDRELPTLRSKNTVTDFLSLFIVQVLASGVGTFITVYILFRLGWLR